jgi:signal peptidase I
MAPHDRVQVPGPSFPGTAPPNGQPSYEAARFATSQPAGKAMPKSQAPPVKDAFREVVETVVFVVVLVLLLKTFVAEAFVIPTGSMAETLLGYQKWVTCPECGHEYPVNCNDEVDPQHGSPVPVIGGTCPNCRYTVNWLQPDPRNPNDLQPVKDTVIPAWGSGDRVLVSKFPFDNSHFGAAGMPRRFDVVVFKYPKEPQQRQTPMNYIKRLCGLPEETIAIFNGDLYVLKPGSLDWSNHPQPTQEKDRWEDRFTYTNDPEAEKLFFEGAFEILRKSPDEMMAMRRIVYDNDHQAKDLVGRVRPRWQAENGWLANDDRTPTVFRQTGDSGPQTSWLRYQNLIIDRGNLQPLGGVAAAHTDLIRDFMGYNNGISANAFRNARASLTNWVGDLMLECTATVDTPQGELTLELSKGPDRFQARFDLKAGNVSLWRLTGGQAAQMGPAVPAIARPGTYRLRFANIDSRLTVWVDGSLPFQSADRREGGIDYSPWIPKKDDGVDPAKDTNNLEPASIGASGAANLSVAHVQLWRDTFYTASPQSSEVNTRDLRTMYVQPGHYLCLGDNSMASSDSRYWGLVPERLLVGRALLVYYPFFHGRMGVIR